MYNIRFNDTNARFTIGNKNTDILNSDYFVRSRFANYFITDRKVFLLEQLTEELLKEEACICVFLSVDDAYVVFNNSDSDSLRFNIANNSKLKQFTSTLSVLRFQHSADKIYFVTNSRESEETLNKFKLPFENITARINSNILAICTTAHKKNEIISRIATTIATIFVAIILAFIFSSNFIVGTLNKNFDKTIQENLLLQEEIHNIKSNLIVEESRYMKDDKLFKSKKLIFHKAEPREVFKLQILTENIEKESAFVFPILKENTNDN